MTWFCKCEYPSITEDVVRTKQSSDCWNHEPQRAFKAYMVFHLLKGNDQEKGLKKFPRT